MAAAHLGLLVDGQVVEHDDIPGAERGHEDLLDIGEKTGVVDRAVKDGRRRQPLEPQRGDDRVVSQWLQGVWSRSRMPRGLRP